MFHGLAALTSPNLRARVGRVRDGPVPEQVVDANGFPFARPLGSEGPLALFSVRSMLSAMWKTPAERNDFVRLSM